MPRLRRKPVRSDPATKDAYLSFAHGGDDARRRRIVFPAGSHSSCRMRRERSAATSVQLTRAPGNGAPIGGLKVVTASGWFAARPSGTEAVYKIYAESFRDEQHLQMLVNDAQQIVQTAIMAAHR